MNLVRVIIRSIFSTINKFIEVSELGCIFDIDGNACWINLKWYKVRVNLGKGVLGRFHIYVILTGPARDLTNRKEKSKLKISDISTYE